MPVKTVNELARQPIPMRLYIALKLLGAHGSMARKDATYVGNMSVMCMLDKKAPTEGQANKLVGLIKQYGLVETYKEMMEERGHKEFFIPGKDEP